MLRMRSISFAAVVLLVSTLAPAAEKPVVYDLWPGTVPAEKGNIGEEKFADPRAGEKPPLKRLTNVSKPTLTVYRPTKARDTGTALIVAPGGGYTILAWEHEGTQVAEWLSSLGITGVLLNYRVPRRPDQPKDAPPVGALQDAQRAVSMVRGRAHEWGVDPHRVGMLGFSAGGHLAAWAATNADRRAYEPVDEADRRSCRPDFVILMYPGGLVDKQSPEQLSPEIRVSKAAPPSFLAVAYNDNGSLASTVRMFRALKQAGVPAELHVFATGGHGFGMRSSDKPYAAWTKRCEEWLRSEGWLAGEKK
jgi:acetyl esterase/lipase